jgi:CheY-like chemotaxis protein
MTIKQNTSAAQTNVVLNLRNRTTVSRILEEFGYCVALAANGFAAISELRQNPYDWFFMKTLEA